MHNYKLFKNNNKGGYMLEEILKLCDKKEDILNRTIECGSKKVSIVYCETLTDSSLIEKYIIKPLKNHKGNIKEEITSSHIKEIKGLDEALTEIFHGSTIIIIDNKELLSIETKKNLDRSIEESSTEGTISGPKDSFNENFNTNIGLIRKRIKNNNLNLETTTLGKESNTKVGILYMNNIVDKDLLKKVKENLSKIKNDVIIDGSYIREELSKKSLFPESNMTERPDEVTFSLLEGKVCIVTDNSPNVIIIPTFFIDFFHNPEDYYQKNINSTFLRILRVLAFIMAIFLPGFYISITTHNPTSIPTNLLLSLIKQHEQVPFPAFFEILIMTIAFEILRESDIRSPSKVGSSSSILGGLILGEAAVSAGIISPILIIIVAISSISSFVFPYNSIVNQIRYYKLLILLLGTLLGLFGLFIGLVLLISNIASITSFGYPYTYPFVPLVKKDLNDSIVKIETGSKTRNPLLTKEMKRI